MRKIVGNVIDSPLDCPYRMKFVCNKNQIILHICGQGISDTSASRCTWTSFDDSPIFPDSCPLEDAE